MITRFLEYVHLYRLLDAMITSLLIMSVSMIESFSFLQEIKLKAMREANFTDKQINEFMTVWDNEMDMWKNLSISKIINNLPARFQSYVPFTNWKEAVDYLSKKTGG